MVVFGKITMYGAAMLYSSPNQETIQNRKRTRLKRGLGVVIAACALSACAQTRTVWIDHVGQPELPAATTRDVAVYVSEDLLNFAPEPKEGSVQWRFPEFGRSLARVFVTDLRERFANVGRAETLPGETAGRSDLPLVIDLRAKDVEWKFERDAVEFFGESTLTVTATVRVSLTV